jgi:hypothetical protein
MRALAFVLYVSFVLCSWLPLRRADHSFGGVQPIVFVGVCVIQEPQQTVTLAMS